MRVTKVVDTPPKTNRDRLRWSCVKHTYKYVNGLLVYEDRGDISFIYDYDAYGNLSCIHYRWANGKYWKFYVACNARGDVTAIYAADGTLRATYTYDSWGNTISIIDRYGNNIVALGDDAVAADNIGALNRIRYRGYYYDSETGLYYLQSRYYDPQVKRFVNADDADVVTATPASLNDKNLFAYCDNNPVSRVDVGGGFWDTVLDVVSLAFSIKDVIENPKDVGAWVGLVGDAVDVLVPCVTGIGEITRAVNTSRKITKAADNLHDAGKAAENLAEAATDAKKVKELHRPYIRKSTRDAVEKAAKKTSDGKFLDANMLTPINGKYDLGHVAGHEFWWEKQQAMAKGWTQKQFNDYMNNPAFYQIEDPHWNRSHIFEDKH